MKLITSSLLFLVVFSIPMPSYPAEGIITGKVKYLRTHQYLDNSAWDKNTWFCLSSLEQIGSCRISADHCGDSTQLFISRDAHPEVFSMIIAAQLSKTPLRVGVNDEFKVNNMCVARWIDIITE